MQCTMPQQVYCAAQIAYNVMNATSAFDDRLTAIEESVKRFEERMGGNVMPLKHKKGSGAIEDSQDKTIDENE